MAMTDPLGDMLTRIRNGAARRKSSGSHAGFAASAHAFWMCLQAEGYIRGYSEGRIWQRQGRVHHRAEVLRRRVRDP
ncbi:30S ribosomal protein S8 [Ensifer canadensis]